MATRSWQLEIFEFAGKEPALVGAGQWRRQAEGPHYGGTENRRLRSRVRFRPAKYWVCDFSHTIALSEPQNFSWLNRDRRL